MRDPGLKRSIETIEIFVLLAISCSCAAALAQQAYPPAYPRTNAKLVLQNDRVNAWEVYWPKGQPTPMHEHTIDQLSITLSGGSVRVTTPDGKVNEGHSYPGMVVFTRHGTVHQEEGTSDVPQHKIMLEVKPSPAKSSDSTSAPNGAFPPEGAVKALENDRLIAWDFTWKPGEKVPINSNFDSVTVFLVGGTMRGVDGTGGAKEIERKPGDVVYSSAAEAHTEEAISGSPRAIIVQLR